MSFDSLLNIFLIVVERQVVNEVQVMHKLESPHILKFHDWYETRNNLWLILEYCTGADLESLLKQDGHLPEASVRMFGLDMVAALKVCFYLVSLFYSYFYSISVLFFVHLFLLFSCCSFYLSSAYFDSSRMFLSVRIKIL